MPFVNREAFYERGDNMDELKVVLNVAVILMDLAVIVTILRRWKK